MSNSILVAYTTRYGATEEVAQAIANTLYLEGFEVDLKLIRNTTVLSKYQAVVMGAPLYIGKWHRDVHRFLNAHQEFLTRHPLAIFALGPVSTDPEEMKGSRQQLDKEMARHPWLKPVTVEMFVGKYDPAKLNLLHKLLSVLPASPLHSMPASDNRDWHAIRNWSAELPERLELQPE